MTTETWDSEAWSREYDAKMAKAVADMAPEWGVRKYRAHQTHDGVAFVFDLTRNGVTVGYVEDSGVGGGPFVSFVSASDPASQAWFAEADRLFGAESMGRHEDIVEALLMRAGK